MCKIFKGLCARIRKTRLVLLLLLIILIYVIVEVCVYYSLPDWGKRGTFGDSFGAVNALFSGLAFAGLIYTIYLQKEELGLQREELKMTRGELEGQKEEFHIQNETLKVQRFENTFFQLLSLHHQIVDGITFIESYEKTIEKEPTSHDALIQLRMRGLTKERTIEEAERTYRGRAVFQIRYDGLKGQIEKDENIEVVNAKYLVCYGYFQNDAGHYFRNLYRIFKFVDNSPFTHEEKYSYTSMVRAQLSDYELLWIFYNCLSENGEEKFRPLVERYAIFKNLPVSKLANPLHNNFYNESVFKHLS